jgi:SprT protein
MIAIRRWIRFACDCNGVPELAQTFIIEWDRRFTSRLGDGSYNRISMRARIRLSIPLWQRASAQDRRETVVHEACHVIVDYKQGYNSRPHGSEWKKAMKNCGLEPRRLHSVDRTGLARKRRRFVLCDCPHDSVEKKCRIRAREFNLVRKGTEFWCKVCGLHLNLNSSIEEDRTASATV